MKLRLQFRLTISLKLGHFQLANYGDRIIRGPCLTASRCRQGERNTRANSNSASPDLFLVGCRPDTGTPCSWCHTWCSGSHSESPSRIQSPGDTEVRLLCDK